MKHFFLTLALICLSLQPTTAKKPANLQTEKPMSVGLVLSGGGAKGIAHIGVIRALEEHNIPIDYIAGTSMGAIVGGLYAAGYTPDEMMQLIQSKDFANWSTGQINERLTYYFFKNEPSPAMLSVALPTGSDSTKTSSILPSSLISPIPMNFAFMELFSRFTAQCKGDFNNLFVPLRTVTSDVYHKHKIVCRNGSLGDAIRASMSFPVVFHPIEMDSVLVFDGGIYDNFPVDVMRSDFAPDIMIGVDVSAPDGKPKANDLLQQLEDMIIQNNDYELPADEGIKLRINLQRFSLLDFAKAPQIEKIGYDHAMTMMDSITRRVTSRVPAEERNLRRAVFKSNTPYVIFDSVEVKGGTERQNRYFKNIFTENHLDTFGLRHAKDAYYRAITGGKLRNLVPEAVYRPSDRLFTLRLKASVKDNVNVGFGGYITSSTNSMVFLSAGYNTLSLNHFEAKLNTWIGQSYMAARTYGKIFFSSGHPSSLMLDATVWRMNYNSNTRFFYEQNPTYVSELQTIGRLRYGIAAGRNAKAELSAGFGHIAYRYYPTATTSINVADTRNRSLYNLGQIALDFDFNTLDNQLYPSSGNMVQLSGNGMAGTYRYTPSDPEQMPERTSHPWLQGELKTKNYFSTGPKFSLGIETEILASTRKLPSTFDQALVTAPEFYPVASTFSTFNPDFRAYSYVGASLVPVVKLSENFQLRTTLSGFLPMRRIKTFDKIVPVYGKWFSDPTGFAQIAAVYNFPFASLSVYGNYIDAPSRHWSCGLSFGLFFLAPKFF